jgi:2-oxoglutarate-Fe(II)-dependent dioxygenase family protein
MNAEAPDARDLSPLWRDLSANGMISFRDIDVGIAPALRDHIENRYFASDFLRSDNPVVHRDRDRARDVIRYEWDGNRLATSEHDTIEITNRSGYAGSRTPARVELLADPAMSEWMTTALSLVPPIRRQRRGTFGVNLMRTRHDIVAGPHQDDEEYVFIYLVDKIGNGAVTTLHPVDDPSRTAYCAALNPGDFLIFRDDTFLHYVTPLTAGGGVQPRRDALVCTVDYPHTYGAR